MVILLLLFFVILLKQFFVIKEGNNLIVDFQKQICSKVWSKVEFCSIRDNAVICFYTQHAEFLVPHFSSFFATVNETKLNFEKTTFCKNESTRIAPVYCHTLHQLRVCWLLWKQYLVRKNLISLGSQCTVCRN